MIKGLITNCGDQAEMATKYQRIRRRRKDLGNWRLVRYADLCRARHKSAYADCLVMPREVVEVLVSAVGVTVWSA